MENKKDIGKAFSEKLDLLDKNPNEDIWNSIEKDLKKKKKRRIGLFFFWSKTLGLLLFGTLTTFYFCYHNGSFNSGSTKKHNETIILNDVNGKTIPNDLKKINSSENNRKNIVTENENSSERNKNINNKRDKKTKDFENNESENASKTVNKNIKANSISSKSINNKSNLFSKKNIKKANKKTVKKSKKRKAELPLIETFVIKNDNQIADLSSLKNKISAELGTELNLKTPDSILKKAKEKMITVDMFPKDSVKKDSAKIYKKFYIDAFASPTSYGYFGKNSTIDSRLNSLSKKSEIKFSYGFGLTYDLTKKLSLRIGYRKINSSYITKNAPIDELNYSGVDYNSNVSNQSILYGDNFPLNGSARVDITQKISYTEIPLEVKYTFLDKKIGLRSSFGFSYLFLDENKVSIKTDNGFSQNIGRTKNLSSTSVSVNLGVEMDYPLFTNTKIFVEPMFNYQIKAFSEGNYKPYVFGIHTGIRYSLNN